MRKYLKEAREKLGLRQSDVAERIGISTNYYCDIENGNRQSKMKAPLLIALSTVLQIPASTMLEFEKERSEQERSD